MEDKNEKHVSPNEISEGDVVQISTNEFFKVIRKISSNKIKGKKVTPNHDPDPEDERVIPVNNCKRCISARSFGQHKRFIPPDQGGAGTGFSKQGRKLKHPRSSLLDDKNIDKQARDYILGEVSTEEFLERGSDSIPDDGTSLRGRGFKNTYPDLRLREIINIQRSQNFAGFQGIQDPTEAERAFFDASNQEKLSYLSQWDQGEYHGDVVTPEPDFGGRGYETYVSHPYVLHYNFDLGSATLYIIEEFID